MSGPDIILDINKKYLSINPDKYIDVVYKEVNINKVEEQSLSFIRNRPLMDMRAKMSMCCLVCGSTSQVGESIKLKSQLSTERYIKNFSKKRRF